jgi:hypothetical protein
MTAERQTTLPVQAGTLGNAVSKSHANHTTPTLVPQDPGHAYGDDDRPGRPLLELHPTPPLYLLNPRQQRAITAFNENPGGLLSYELGRIVGAMNVPDLIMTLRGLGFNIPCELEPFITQDGVKSRVGRYRLIVQEGQQI